MGFSSAEDFRASVWARMEKQRHRASGGPHTLDAHRSPARKTLGKAAVGEGEGAWRTDPQQDEIWKGDGVVRKLDNGVRGVSDAVEMT